MKPGIVPLWSDHTPSRKKPSGLISWAYHQNVVRTNEIARLLIVITLYTHKLEKITANSLCHAILPLLLDCVRQRYVVATTSEDFCA